MKKKIIAGAVIGVAILSMLFAAWHESGNKVTRGLSAPGGKVAVVYIEGVMSGSQSDSLWGGNGASSGSVSANLRKAANNAEIKAVVLRLNSPGGTPVAAQEISNEIARLQESGKFVVSSMGDTAASAAYWVAACTDEIVANPGTLTGSIGVIMETTNLRGLFDSFGVEQETIKSGPFKDIGSYSRPVTKEERAILQSMVDDIYDQFVEAVAQGRDMETDQVRLLADGRVFTGRQAMELGLVDQMGDMRDAIALAGELAGIKGEPVVVHIGGGGNIWQSLVNGSLESLALDVKKALLDNFMSEDMINIR